VTLNDLEQGNGGYVNFTEFGSFPGALHKSVEDTPTLSVAEM